MTIRLCDKQRQMESCFLGGQFPNCQSCSFITPRGQFLTQWIWVMIIRWQSILVNTKESILLGCDKPYHTNKRTKCTERAGDCFAEQCIAFVLKHMCSLYCSQKCTFKSPYKELIRTMNIVPYIRSSLKGLVNTNMVNVW